LWARGKKNESGRESLNIEFIFPIPPLNE